MSGYASNGHALQEIIDEAAGRFDCAACDGRSYTMHPSGPLVCEVCMGRGWTTSDAYAKLAGEMATLKAAALAVLDKARTHVLGDGQSCCKTCPSAVLRALVTDPTSKGGAS